MTYIDYIKRFWRSHEEYHFSTTEIALYFHLLEICNVCRWSDTFRRNNSKIGADLGISYRVLVRARNKLKQANLIEFITQNGSPNTTYSIMTFDKIDEVVDEVTDEVAVEVGDEVVDELIKTKTKTKTRTPKPLFDETVFENEELQKHNPQIYPTEQFPVELVEQCLQNDGGWIELTGMALKLKGEQEVRRWVKQFFIEIRAKGECHKSLSDAKGHFVNWMKYQTTDKQNRENNGRRVRKAEI